MKVFRLMSTRLLKMSLNYLKGAVLSASFLGCAWSATCSFEPVKKEIDFITDAKTQQGQAYSQKVHEGWDSVKVLSDMSSADMKKSIDVCRFEVAEYLTKLGFAPAH